MLQSILYASFLHKYSDVYCQNLTLIFQQLAKVLPCRSTTISKTRVFFDFFFLAVSWAHFKKCFLFACVDERRAVFSSRIFETSCFCSACTISFSRFDFCSSCFFFKSIILCLTLKTAFLFFISSNILASDLQADSLILTSKEFL